MSIRVICDLLNYETIFEARLAKLAQNRESGILLSNNISDA